MARDIGYLFCRLHGAPEIAAVERRKTLARQPLRKRLGLHNSLFGQLAIEMPLPNPASIPFGLAMPNNDHLRALHECLTRMVRGKKSTMLLRQTLCASLAQESVGCSLLQTDESRRKERVSRSPDLLYG